MVRPPRCATTASTAKRTAIAATAISMLDTSARSPPRRHPPAPNSLPSCPGTAVPRVSRRSRASPPRGLLPVGALLQLRLGQVVAGLERHHDRAGGVAVAGHPGVGVARA